MKYLKSLMLVLAIISILCVPVPVSATSQGTNGTELEVMQPEKLEIQLGESWAGVEFEMKTDAGMYPGVIPVGEDGILRLEIGGSTSYILTCLNSVVDAPVPGETAPIAENESGTEATEDIVDPDVPGDSEETEAAETDPTETAPAEENNEDTTSGIPVANLIMFGIGLLIAVGVLIGISVHNKRKTASDIDENDEF